MKLRATNVNKTDFPKQFYSAPTARNEDICNLLAEIHRKTKTAEQTEENSGIEEVDSSGNTSSKWYYISDAHVSEVSEEKVMKCQAYLLFYERIK